MRNTNSNGTIVLNFYVKQRWNICKTWYFSEDVSKVSDNKMFWKTVKPRFSKKFKTANTIILTQGDMIMKNDKIIGGAFNNYFAGMTKSLKLKKHLNFDGQSLSSITDYFKNNECVIKIIEKKKKKSMILKITYFNLLSFKKRTFLR